jgi:hypothetical protein
LTDSKVNTALVLSEIERIGNKDAKPGEYCVARAGWQHGPWDAEVDRVEWVHDEYPCLILRNSLGNWCGYVGVEKGHPAYGLHYDQLDYSLKPSPHGGLTFSNFCNGAICHKWQACTNPWWFGFDCAHYNDYIPGMDSDELRALGLSLMSSGLAQGTLQYRTQAFARMETQEMAEQLARMNRWPFKLYVLFANKTQCTRRARDLRWKIEQLFRRRQAIAFSREFALALRRNLTKKKGEK